MNFGLDEDQQGIVSGLEQLLGRMSPPVPVEPAIWSPAPDLEAALHEAGYLDIARIDGCSILDAALIVERLARLPHAIEIAASAIVAPALGIEPDNRPIAMVRGDGTAPARFLPSARLLLVDRGDDALAIRIEPGRVEPVETLFAYPYGRLASLDGLESWPVDGNLLRRTWRIALALEAAGAYAAALETVLDHVKTRQAFGKPLGAFQAIQHRLAMASETAEAARWLAFRAADTFTDADAAIAAGFAQARIARTSYDLHQFVGAMGLTLEFPLHYWTYRLRALAGELGGASQQSRAAAAATWPVRDFPSGN